MSEMDTRRDLPKPRILLARAHLPNVSGKLSVFILVLCFALTGLLIPMAAHLPRWIEIELVMGTYWFVWLVAMSVLLYQGWRIQDDMSAPDWNRRRLGNLGDSTPDASGCGDIVLEGCLSELEFLGIVLLLLLSAWLLIEFIVPAVAFLAYWLIRGMLSRAVNDTRDCRGRFLRSLFWGSLWASLYTAPLALLVWGLHLWLRHGA